MTRRQLLASLGVLFGAPAIAARAQFRAMDGDEVLRGRFIQERQLKGFDRPLISRGDFVLAPGRGLIWRTLIPFDTVTILTASGLVQDVNGSETTRLDAARLPFLGRLYHLLAAALSGDWSGLDKLFQVTRHGDASQWELALVPRAGGDALSMPFQSINLRGGQFLDEALIVRPDEDTDRLTFSDQALGAALTADEAARLRDAAK